MADQLLGKLPAKSDPRALMLARFVAAPKAVPAKTNFWARRMPFPLRTFGNTSYGCCVRASQAILAMRMERLETKVTPDIKDEEVIRVYQDMSNRLYGGGDNGAFELDGLNEWRRPDLTFRDTKGRPLTIEAFLAINHTDQQAIKEAIFTAGAHGIKVCFSLPIAFQTMRSPQDWDVPTGQALTGNWLRGSWGGHSTTCRSYDEKGMWIAHTWGIPDQRITWEAVAAYADESFLAIDSIDSWRKRTGVPKKVGEAIKSAVNSISDQKIK